MGVNVGLERWLSGQRACDMSMDLSSDPQHPNKTGHDKGFLQLQHWVIQTKETGLWTNCQTSIVKSMNLRFSDRSGLKIMWRVTKERYPGSTSGLYMYDHTHPHAPMHTLMLTNAYTHIQNHYTFITHINIALNGANLLWYACRGHIEWSAFCSVGLECQYYLTVS